MNPRLPSGASHVSKLPYADFACCQVRGPSLVASFARKEEEGESLRVSRARIDFERRKKNEARCRYYGRSPLSAFTSPRTLGTTTRCSIAPSPTRSSKTISKKRCDDSPRQAKMVRATWSHGFDRPESSGRIVASNNPNGFYDGNPLFPAFLQLSFTRAFSISLPRSIGFLGIAHLEQTYCQLCNTRTIWNTFLFFS